jgi:hypothetical protein
MKAREYLAAYGRGRFVRQHAGVGDDPPEMSPNAPGSSVYTGIGFYDSFQAQFSAGNYAAAAKIFVDDVWVAFNGITKSGANPSAFTWAKFMEVMGEGGLGYPSATIQMAYTMADGFGLIPSSIKNALKASSTVTTPPAGTTTPPAGTTTPPVTTPGAPGYRPPVAGAKVPVWVWIAGGATVVLVGGLVIWRIKRKAV